MAYLSAYIPEANSAQRSVKTSWAGLNQKQTQDTGELLCCENITLRDYPFLRSVRETSAVFTPSNTDKVVSIHPTGEGSYVAFTCPQNDERALIMHYFDKISYQPIASVQVCDNYDQWNAIPSVAVFNVYEGDENIVAAKFERKILIYPFCLSYTPGADTVESFNTSGNAVPRLENVTVLNGRVFGVLDGKFYASAWNDYTDWVLPAADTPEENKPSMAWCSTTQSDIDASGDFTGITVYNGQVIGFKRNFMHMIYNNKNPFRIVDIAKVGALSQEAICEVNRVLFFVADDGVYAFSGGYPTRISDKLDYPVGEFEGATLGGDDRTLYCYLPSQSETYTYDTVSGTWGNIEIDGGICATVDGKCLFVRENAVYQYESSSRYSRFSFTTDASFGGALVEKKIKRVRLQVSHENHEANDSITVRILKSDDSYAAGKTFSPGRVGDFVISMLTRTTCDFGQKINVSGTGDWVIKYLQIDYESGGEKYV